MKHEPGQKTILGIAILVIGCAASRGSGNGVMARGFDRQVAVLQIGAAILNRFTALETPQTQRMK